MKCIGNNDNITGAVGMLRHPASLEDMDQTNIPRIERLVDVSILTTFLRNFPLGNLTEEERHQFLAFQSYFVGIEAQWFDAAGFY